MDVLIFETCRAVNSEIIKQATSSWSIVIQLTTEMLNKSLSHVSILVLLQNKRKQRQQHQDKQAKKYKEFKF
jgi:hypothetical protein